MSSAWCPPDIVLEFCPNSLFWSHQTTESLPLCSEFDKLQTGFGFSWSTQSSRPDWLKCWWDVVFLPDSPNSAKALRSSITVIRFFFLPGLLNLVGWPILKKKVLVVPGLFQFSYWSHCWFDTLVLIFDQFIVGVYRVPWASWLVFIPQCEFVGPFLYRPVCTFIKYVQYNYIYHRWTLFRFYTHLK